MDPNALADLGAVLYLVGAVGVFFAIAGRVSFSIAATLIEWWDHRKRLPCG